MSRVGRKGETVTVRLTTPEGRGDAIAGAKYELTFSRLPGRAFGPYDFMEARGQLEIAALLPSVDARNLLLDAFIAGEATAPRR